MRWKPNISHVRLCVFTTIKRKSPGVTFHVELSWLFWLLWQMLPHLCVNIEKGTVGMLRGFHLSSTSSRGTLSAGELWRRWVIKRPSGWKHWWKEIAAPLWTRLQQLQQQTSLTTADGTELLLQARRLWARLQMTLLRRFILIYSFLTRHYLCMYTYSCTPPGSR